ncbi:MAG: hypothetical protein U0893_07725 [Chloroflexota bacterium]
MLSATPTVQPPADDAAPGRAETGRSRLAWRRLLPRPRRLTRLLALGLAVCVTSQAALAPVAAAQLAAPPLSTHAVAQQPPTPTATPAPTTGPQVIVPVELSTPVQIGGEPTPNSIDVQLTPTPAPSITVRSGAGAPSGACTSPDFIFQGCPMAEALGQKAGSDAERRLEDRAIALVLQQYGLPESARPLVRRYARPEIRAALYADVQEAFKQIPDERSPDQQLLVDVYSKLVRESHTKAMKAAQAEYRRWNNDPCGYEPPTDFSYDARSACIGASRGFRPESPGLEAFVSYGFKNTYQDMVVDDPWASSAFIAASSGAQILYGAAATGYAAIVGAQIEIPATVLRVIAPFSARAALAVEGVSAGSAGAGATFAGTFAILVATISTIITGSMSLAREAEIPNQLQGMVDMAPTYDIEWIVRNCTSGCVNAATSDLRGQVDFEMYTAFMFTTLPDFPGTDAAPAVRPGDPRLAVDGRPVDWMRYKANDKDGSPRAFRLGSGAWFVDRADGDGDSGARLTLQVNYRDAAGGTWAVRRAGDQFIIVRTGLAPTNIDYVLPRQSADLAIVDPSGRTVTARVAK